MKVIRDQPISMWRAEVPAEKTLLDAVHNLQISHSAFRVAAVHFDHLLAQFARRFNAARGAISANDPSVISYVLGSLQGFQPTEILRWVGGGIRKEPGWLEEARMAAGTERDIIDAHNSYARARHDLGAKVTALMEALDAQPHNAPDRQQPASPPAGGG